jgi:hypothetical protein
VLRGGEGVKGGKGSRRKERQQRRVSRTAGCVSSALTSSPVTRASSQRELAALRKEGGGRDRSATYTPRSPDSAARLTWMTSEEEKMVCEEERRPAGRSASWFRLAGAAGGARSSLLLLTPQAAPDCGCIHSHSTASVPDRVQVASEEEGEGLTS